MEDIVFKVTQKQLDLLNINLYQYLYLYLVKNNLPLNIMDIPLVNKGFMDHNSGMSILYNKCISESLSNTPKKEALKKDVFEEIATELRELFPTGIKEGTKEPWRSSVAELTKRLQTLRSKVDFDLDKDKIINATKNYIKSFGNDRRFMRTSKYFIFKNEIKANQVEFKSEMLAFMEMEENEVIDLNNNDWVSQLK